MLIKETAPVRLLDAVLEELDYKELQHLYSPNMAFQRFFARCTLDILMDLFSQLMEAINRRDTLTFNEVFFDVTKLEANADKYIFV